MASWFKYKYISNLQTAEYGRFRRDLGCARQNLRCASVQHCNCNVNLAKCACDDDGTIQGGTGQDLAQQIFEVLTQKLDLTFAELAFLRGEWSTMAEN